MNDGGTGGNVRTVIFRSSLPQGPYTLWYRSDGGFLFQDFESLAEALASAPDKYVGSDFHISKPVKWLPIDADRIKYTGSETFVEPLPETPPPPPGPGRIA